MSNARELKTLDILRIGHRSTQKRQWNQITSSYYGKNEREFKKWQVKYIRREYIRMIYIMHIFSAVRK